MNFTSDPKHLMYFDSVDLQHRQSPPLLSAEHPESEPAVELTSSILGGSTTFRDAGIRAYFLLAEEPESQLASPVPVEYLTGLVVQLFE